MKKVFFDKKKETFSRKVQHCNTTLVTFLQSFLRKMYTIHWCQIKVREHTGQAPPKLNYEIFWDFLKFDILWLKFIYWRKLTSYFLHARCFYLFSHSCYEMTIFKKLIIFRKSIFFRIKLVLIILLIDGAQVNMMKIILILSNF